MVFAFPIERGDRGINLLPALSFFAKGRKKDQNHYFCYFWVLVPNRVLARVVLEKSLIEREMYCCQFLIKIQEDT